METFIEKTNNLEALIKIRIKEDDYQAQLGQKIKDYSKKVNLKGFRPGKVPVGLVKQMYGTALKLEEINQLVSEQLRKTLVDTASQYLGEPMPSDQQTSIDWDSQQDFEFIFSIGYADDFTVPVDKKTKIDYYKIKVDDQVINETIDNLRKQHGTESETDTVALGDSMYGTLVSGDGTITQEVSIDTAEIEKSYVKKAVGQKLESTLDIDVTKWFTHKYYFERVSRIREEEIKKVKGKFSFTIKGIVRVELAEVNEEFFDKIVGKDTVKSLDEFKSRVKETVEKTYVKESENYFYYTIRKKLVEASKIKLPEQFLKKWLLSTGDDQLNHENIEKEFEGYADELKWSLIRNKVMKTAEIKAENDEIMQETKEMIAAQFGGGAIIEQLGSQMDTFAENYLRGEDGKNYQKVYNQVVNKKVFKYIHENITAKEKEITLNEFRNLD